jgi:hypothetical protein
VDQASAGILLRIWFENHFDYTSPPIPYFVGTLVDVPTSQAAGEQWLHPIPTPTTGLRTVRIDLDVPGPVDLALFDVTGRRVETLHSGMLAAGAHAVSVRSRGLATGVYVVRLATTAGQESQKVHILR